MTRPPSLQFLSVAARGQPRSAKQAVVPLIRESQFERMQLTLGLSIFVGGVFQSACEVVSIQQEALKEGGLAVSGLSPVL